MAVLALRQTIMRPVHDVFTTLADIGNFATWNPTIKSSRQTSQGEPGLGTLGEWDLRGFGTVKQELQELDVDKRVRIVPLMKSMSGGHRFTLTDMGDSTQVDHELEMTPRGIFKLMGAMITRTGRKNLDATAAALKRHVEQGSSPPA